MPAQKPLKIRIPGQPQLEAVLQAVADYAAAAAGPELAVGRGLRLQSSGGTHIIELTDEPYGNSASVLDPWQPTFFTTGTGEAKVYKCKFNLGTVNNVPAVNWNAEFTLPSTEGTYKFVLLTITSANGKVSGLTISVATDPPAEDVTAQDAPPAEHVIVLGAIGRSSAKMIIRKNLQMAAEEVFRESKAAPAVGAEPFHRWWRWWHAVV